MVVVNDENIELLKNGCVATIGSFDGVHTGHRFLIDELKSIAKLQNLPTLIVTFSQPPAVVLQPNFRPTLINTLDEKLDKLSNTAVNACAVLDFNLGMAKLSAYEFLKQLIVEKFKIKALLIGHDHRFGRNRSEGFSDYVKYGNMLGLQLIKATKFQLPNYQTPSSSTVRKALVNGDFQLSKSLLGYNYSFKGMVVTGFEIGRKIGFPTANIKPADEFKLIPAMGVYAVKVRINSDSHLGMMNIGIRPTVAHGSEQSIEVHIFDFDRNIYHESVEIEFLQKIREEKKFATIDALVVQLNKDKLEVMKLV